MKLKHIFLVLGFFACLVPLYWAKAQADRMRDNVAALRADIAKEQKAIRTLRAELAWLTSYSRIEKTAREELGLKPIDGQKLVGIQDIDQIAPNANQNQSETSQIEEVGKNAKP